MIFSSLHRSIVAKAINLSLFMILVGCSSDQHYKGLVNGYKAHLDVVMPTELRVPPGMQLPNQSVDYALPFVTLKDSMSERLDIRPPLQLEAQTSSACTQYNNVIADDDSNHGSHELD